MTSHSFDFEKFKPGTMGCHEVLHMLSFLANAVDQEVCEHQAIQSNPEWLAQAKEACVLLSDLYQKVGSVHLGELG